MIATIKRLYLRLPGPAAHGFDAGYDAAWQKQEARIQFLIDRAQRAEFDMADLIAEAEKDEIERQSLTERLGAAESVLTALIQFKLAGKGDDDAWRRAEIVCRQIARTLRPASAEGPNNDPAVQQRLAATTLPEGPCLVCGLLGMSKVPDGYLCLPHFMELEQSIRAQAVPDPEAER